MTETSLAGMRVLVVEDEYVIADELAFELEALGAEVLGPVPTLARARALVETEDRIDAAILDINLRGEMVWPVADQLIGRGVPVVLATGYDASFVPAAYRHLVRCEKPVSADEIAPALRKAAAA